MCVPGSKATVSEMNGITSEKGKMEHLGSHMTHMAEMIETDNFPGYPNLHKVLSIHTPNSPEALEFSFQLRKKAEVLCKEQKQRQSWRCFLWVAAVGEPLQECWGHFRKAT